MAEGVKFEFQSPPLRIEGNQLVWVTTNAGENASEPGFEIDTVHVSRRSVLDKYGEMTHPDTTPWQFDVAVNDVVQPGTAHSATLSLDWPGLEDGAYVAQVWLQQGNNQVYAELNFKVEHGHPDYDTG